MSNERKNEQKTDQGFLFDLFSRMGLSEYETKIYLYLARRGPQTAKQLMDTLKIDKAKMYRSLNNLQTKLLIQSTLGHPSQFIAIPFNDVSQLWIDAEQREIEILKKNCSEIKTALKNLDTLEPAAVSNKISVIEGVNNIISKGATMTAEAAQEILIMDDTATTKAHDYSTSFSTLFHSKNRKVTSRFITRVTPENKARISHIYNKEIKGRSNSRARHTNLSPKFFQRFMIVDEKQLLYSIVTWEEICSKYRQPIEKAIWTNNEAMIRTLQKFFEDTWNQSVDLEVKLQELDQVSTKIP